MRVLDKTPLALSQVMENVKDKEEKKELLMYLKKFSKIDLKKTESLSKALSDLNNPKIKYSDIIKVADFLPSNQEEVNKIFTDVSLSEEEINKILEIVKNYGA